MSTLIPTSTSIPTTSAPTPSSSSLPSPSPPTTKDYTLRPATPSDAEAISALLLYIWPLTYKPYFPLEAIEEHVLPKHSADKVRQSLASEDDKWFVAVPARPLALNSEPINRHEAGDGYGDEDGVEVAQHISVSFPILGLAKIRPTPIPSPILDTTENVDAKALENPTYLALLYVHPSAHGSGLAHDLVRATETAARNELGHDGMWFTVLSQNARAIRFYEKLSYVKIGEKLEEQLFPRIENYMAKKFT